LAPPILADQLHSLPPILYIHDQNPISGYSKGSRGLSVPMRVSGIFTAATVSPSPSLRQRPSCYTIRAGRNLPDKEFRYLRHYCYFPFSGRTGRFRRSLRVATEVGLYLRRLLLFQQLKTTYFPTNGFCSDHNRPPTCSLWGSPPKSGFPADRPHPSHYHTDRLSFCQLHKAKRNLCSVGYSDVPAYSWI
jgi:hypothetical protein